MRMIVPPVAIRRQIDQRLTQFFRTHRTVFFRRAVSTLCRYYNIRQPRIEWCEYIDYGKVAGKTFEDGRIHLIDPENWKRCRVYNRERMWIGTFYHEMGHYLLWTDAERKADLFQRRMVVGLSANRSRRVARKSVRRAASRTAAARTRRAKTSRPVRRRAARGRAAISRRVGRRRAKAA